MVAFICLFFPAVISVWLFDTITRKNISLKEFFYRFCFATVAINFTYFALKVLVLRSAKQELYSLNNDMLPNTAFRYLVVAIPCAIILALVEVLLFKHVKLTAEETTDENEEK